MLPSCVLKLFASEGIAEMHRHVKQCLVQDRYASLVNDLDTPPFHYGSHYSSAGGL